jgi:hypothetical protein
MAWRRQVFHVVWVTTVGVGAFTLLVLAAIQGEQRQQQSRSERLLLDLQAVRLRATPATDIERTFRSRATMSTRCDSATCDYTIEVRSSIAWDLLNLLQHLLLPYHPTLHALLRLGARPALVNAHIETRNGVAWGKGMTVVVATPGHKVGQGYGPDYELIGHVESVSRFHHGPSALGAAFVSHPDYSIGKPGGCDGPCVEGHVIFTPYAAQEDVSRLMQFDLSCLTRWRHPCRTQADILPSAWAQYEREQQLTAPTALRSPTPGLAEVLGRDASAVAVVKIKNVRRRLERDGYVSQLVTADVLEVMKGAKFWHEGAGAILQAWEHQLRLHNDECLIVLLDPIWTETESGIFNVSSWQVLPPTPDNLARVRTGIAEDFENSESKSPRGRDTPRRHRCS